MKELDGTKIGGEIEEANGGFAAASAAEIEVLEPRESEPEVLDGGSAELVLAAGSLPTADRHPALVYLASLSPGSRKSMRGALERIALLVSGGKATVLTLAWHELRYQHTALIRSALAEAYAPATANKMLSALRGVLKECFI